MKSHRIVAGALAFALASSSAPTALLAQQSTSLAGTAKDEAKTPYSDYVVRARDIKGGTIGATIPLDGQGGFSLTSLSAMNYIVELVRVKKDGKDLRPEKIVCTEGPFDLSKQAIKSDVVVDCGKVPVAWWLLGAAAAAGITAGIVAANASASR